MVVDRVMTTYVTAYITNTHAPPTHWVECPVCKGCITFNLYELEERRKRGQSTSVYCAGPDHHTTNGGDRNNHYHPGYPPEPIYRIPWVEQDTVLC
jgi:hypothetical protein